MTNKRTFLVFANCAALCCGILLLGIYLFVPSEKEAESYHTLMEKAQNAKKESKTTPYHAKQERVGVLKEAFFIEGPHRHKLRLTASDAEMVFNHNSDDRTEIVEKMHHVKCAMQEELFYQLPDGREVIEQRDGKLLIRHEDPKKEESYVVRDAALKPMQIIRLMEANDADYYYTSDRFVASNVKLSRYIVPGHELVIGVDKRLKPVMSGVADNVEFSLSGKLNFKATKMKATFLRPL